MRNAGHMKRFVDPGTEKGATETELPALSVTTNAPKGVSFKQNPVGGIQQNSQAQSVHVPLPLNPAQEGPKNHDHPVRKRETPERLCVPIVTELYRLFFLCIGC